MPLLSEKTPKWWNITGLVMLFVTLVLLVFVLSQGSSVQDAVKATKASVERTDCARKVNAEQVRARDDATLADRAVSRFYYKALFTSASTGEPTTDDQRVEFGKLLVIADAADEMVAGLPDPSKEVNRRCPD